MDDKLKVTSETATGDANGLAKALGQLAKHRPYIEQGLADGMFDDLKPYTLKRLRNAVDQRAEVVESVNALLDLAEAIVERNSVDA